MLSNELNVIGRRSLNSRIDYVDTSSNLDEEDHPLLIRNDHSSIEMHQRRTAPVLSPAAPNIRVAAATTTDDQSDENLSHKMDILSVYVCHTLLSLSARCYISFFTDE